MDIKKDKIIRVAADLISLKNWKNGKSVFSKLLE